ncbi:hypothetical protein [Gymnodinialimonas sp.]
MALGAVLAVAPVSAGTPADAGARITAILAASGPTSTGIQMMNTTVTGCQFVVAFDAIENGDPLSGQLTGNLTDISGDAITLRPNETDQDLFFELPGPLPEWTITAVAPVGTELFTTLSTDPAALPYVAADCNETQCDLIFDIGGGWDTYTMNVDLTEVVSRPDADLLLVAFRDLAGLCNDRAE